MSSRSLSQPFSTRQWLADVSTRPTWLRRPWGIPQLDFLHPRTITSQSTDSATKRWRRSGKQHGGRRRPVWSPTTETGKQDLEHLVASVRRLADQSPPQKQDEQLLHESQEAEDCQSRNQGTAQLGTAVSSPHLSPLEFRKKKEGQYKPRRASRNEHNIANNPWARVLAAPVRMCHASRARVPASLLVEWGLVTNPTDKQEYLVPNALAELKTFHNKIFPGTTKRKQDRILGNTGSKLRITPQQLLIDFLTGRIAVFEDNTCTTRIVRKGSVETWLIPQRWRMAADKAAGYRLASQPPKVPGNSALVPSPKRENAPKRDYSHVSWLTDISGRMLEMIRSRVLIALNALGKANTREGVKELGKQTKADTIVTFSSLDGGDADPFDHRSTSDAQGPARSSQGGVILHIGSPARFADVVKSIHRSRSQSQYPIPRHRLVPPMASAVNGCGIPLFNLETLLGVEYTDLLGTILSGHPPFARQELGTKSNSSLADTDTTTDNADEEYFVLVNSDVPLGSTFIEELWQLWRYSGGRAALGPAGREDARASGVPESTGEHSFFPAMKQELRNILALDANQHVPNDG